MSKNIHPNALKGLKLNRHSWIQNGMSKSNQKCVTCGMEKTKIWIDRQLHCKFFKNGIEVENTGCTIDNRKL